MAIQKISIHPFLVHQHKLPVLDVRSPGEYAQAHIPGAFSLPLFSDEERREIGTAYKQRSRQLAIKAGLRYFGGRMSEMVETVEKLIDGHRPGQAEPTVIVHCWRGGMRSAAVAWLLDLYGFNVMLLVGGYKAYRRWVLHTLDQPFRYNVIGGQTGSGKTETLLALQKQGHAAIDLEGLAGHKGSAFGNLDRKPQPSQEQFDNLLANALLAHCERSEQGGLQQKHSIWLEDESIRIGQVNLTNGFYRNLKASPLYVLDVPQSERLQNIVKDYGRHAQEQLVNGIVRIRKKLGGQHAQEAIGRLLQNDTAGCFDILLHYYDKTYRLNLEASGQKPVLIHAQGTDAAQKARLLLQAAHNNEHGTH